MDSNQATHSELLFINAIEKSIQKLIDKENFSDDESEERYRYSIRGLRVKAYEGYFSPNRILYFQKSDMIEPVYDEFQIFRMSSEPSVTKEQTQELLPEIEKEDKSDIYDSKDDAIWWSE